MLNDVVDFLENRVREADACVYTFRAVVSVAEVLVFARVLAPCVRKAFVMTLFLRWLLSLLPFGLFCRFGRCLPARADSCAIYRAATEGYVEAAFKSTQRLRRTVQPVHRSFPGAPVHALIKPENTTRRCRDAKQVSRLSKCLL